MHYRHPASRAIRGISALCTIVARLSCNSPEIASISPASSRVFRRLQRLRHMICLFGTPYNHPTGQPAQFDSSRARYRPESSKSQVRIAQFQNASPITGPADERICRATHLIASCPRCVVGETRPRSSDATRLQSTRTVNQRLVNSARDLTASPVSMCWWICTPTTSTEYYARPSTRLQRDT